MTVAETIILTGPDGTEYSFPGVNKVSVRKSGGGRAEYGLGGGGAFASLIDRTITTVSADDLDGVTIIGALAFAGSKLESITIPSSVTSMKYGAFMYATSLQSLTIPDTGGYFGDYLLVPPYSILGGHMCQQCRSLKTVTFGESTYILGEDNFYGCDYLTTIVLSAHVIDMQGMFNGCTRLTSITIKNTTPPSSVDSNTFNGVPSSCNIYVPASSVSAYKSASGWSARAAYIRAIPT